MTEQNVLKGVLAGCGAVGVSATVGTVLIAASVQWWRDGPDSIDDVVTVGVGVLGGSGSLYLAAITAVTLLTPRSTRMHHAAVRAMPSIWRHLLSTIGAGALALGLTTPALAHHDHDDAGWLPAPASVSPREPALVEPAPSTSAMVDGAVAALDDQPATTAADDDAPLVHVVAPGESLWAITAGALGKGSSDADIAAAWPLLHRSNLDTIGANPDLIHPGQHLALPEQWR